MGLDRGRGRPSHQRFSAKRSSNSDAEWQHGVPATATTTKLARSGIILRAAGRDESTARASSTGTCKASVGYHEPTTCDGGFQLAEWAVQSPLCCANPDVSAPRSFTSQYNFLLIVSAIILLFFASKLLYYSHSRSYSQHSLHLVFTAAGL